jgi:hypothetical protein
MTERRGNSEKQRCTENVATQRWLAGKKATEKK